MKYLLEKTDPVVSGSLHLDGSKSISNRVLIIRALSGEEFPIEHLSTSDDTRTMERLLRAFAVQKEGELTFDTGAAGTTFRFLTAYLAFQPGLQVLTGSARMLQRPVGPLVEALRQLGGRIEYLGKAGYPPLRILPPAEISGAKISIPAHTSSQFVSALLLVAPSLPNGLQLEMTGDIVSRPYIEMTLALLRHFGIQMQWSDRHIHIEPQPYEPKPFRVEADWSAASYYYAMTAIAREADIELNGLFKDSLQGDAVLPSMMEALGVKTRYTAEGVHLTKAKGLEQPVFRAHFLPCPDLAQTLVVTCAALGKEGHFSGLRTLYIKETDRVMALQRELEKVGVDFKKYDDDAYVVAGKAHWEATPCFKTYEDHRMAMALAPLSLLGPVCMEDPQVVRKSYPAFWEDLGRLDFSVKSLD